MANEVDTEPAPLRQITIRRIAMDPSVWMIVGLCLRPLRWLLKPYAGVEIRVPLDIVATVLMFAGTLRLITAPKRAVPSQFKPYGRGMLVGLMGGLGFTITWVPRFTALPSYAGFLGLGLFVFASVLFFRDRWTAEADPQWVADAQQQKDA